jgi:pectinesterase
MMRKLSLLLLASAVSIPSVAMAQQRALLVAADGTGQFRTVQEAVDSASGGHVRIDIKPGEYRQVVNIAANGIELRGLGNRPEDVVLVFDNTHASTGGTGKSATVTVTGDDFVAENLTVANDFEARHARSEEGSQAVALHVTGDREVFRHVRLLGYQDTLYADSKTCHGADDPGPCRASRQYFSDCYIAGHVDFIFGDAKAVFSRCEIHAMAHSMVTITAQSRLRPSEDSGYVFRDCTVTADAGAGDIYLGRPWRDYSTVIFINTRFVAPLDSKGWMEWAGRLKTSDYAEYGSTGHGGDVSQRLAPGRVLAAGELGRYSTREWLRGADGWNPVRIDSRGHAAKGK